ncbi:MAG: hypothetical protein JNK76_03575 [Planctomycetales bacterium]|nr:hypothetical protein [Planctomycetales bacterium]
MGARQKLNRFYINGSLIFAVVAGVLAQSGLVFVLVLATSIALNMKERLIRPDRNPRRETARR